MVLNMDYVLESYSFLQLIDELLEDFSRYYLRQRKIFRPDLTPYYSLSMEQLLLYISILFSNHYDMLDSYLPEELKPKKPIEGQELKIKASLTAAVGHVAVDNDHAEVFFIYRLDLFRDHPDNLCIGQLVFIWGAYVKDQICMRVADHRTEIMDRQHR